MLVKRIIPCLDIMNNRVVKGINFVNLRDAGSAVELGVQYYEQGADELVFLDISASEEKRKTLRKLVKEISVRIRIPFTVGGGITGVEDISALLEAGADKVAINSAAVKDPSLIERSARQFGSQAIVAAVDVKLINGLYMVCINSGKEETGLEGIEWCKRLSGIGAGEILLTSINADGTTSGYDLNLLTELNSAVTLPVIASGGAGVPIHFYRAFHAGADACLAAGIFHRGEVNIKDLKQYLRQMEVIVRL